MKIEKTNFDDLFKIELKSSFDNRGSSTQIYDRSIFQHNGICEEYREAFVSISKRNTVRGMHFQLPPYPQVKIVNVLNGSILDVVLDVRKNSPTFGKYHTFLIRADSKFALYIGVGFAHGFLSLEDNTTVLYLFSSDFYKDYDSGIKWDSFGFNWKVESPLLSTKDENLTRFNDFESPFHYKEE